MSAPHKSNAMYLAIVGVWLGTSILLWSDLANSLHLLPTGLGRLAFGLLTSIIDVGWLYGCYHIGILSFALLTPRRHLKYGDTEGHVAPPQPIAILHTVCDDFQTDAAASCVSQDYPDFHLYLLDDSLTDEVKKAVDDFALEFHDLVTVVRREDRQGFKAGNLNNALAQIPQHYKYLALADSDTCLPREFLERTSLLLDTNSSAVFVQALHVANTSVRHKLAQDLGEIVKIGWNYYQPVRNKYGFPMCYGHGALIRFDALRTVGGFPEIVSEDIALTLRLRSLGLWGFFTSDVICGEDYPDEYHTFRKRLSRWVPADLECFREELLPFLSAKNISLAERLDATLRGLKVPLAAVFLPFSAAMCLLLFWFPETENLLGTPTVGITLLMALAAYYCFIVDMIDRPNRLFPFVSHLTAVFLSNSFLFTARALEALVSGSARFHVTGTKYNKVTAKGLSKRLLTADETGYPLFGILEIAIGLLMVLLSIYGANLVVLGISTALLLAPAIYAFGWHNRAISILVHVPFILIVLGILTACLLEQVSPMQCLTLACLSILLF